MNKEFLVGGTSKEKRTRAARRKDDDTPTPQVGFRFLLLLILIGATFVGLGAWRVHTVFEARDYEMESGRLQDAMRKRTDRTQTLMARVSHLQRGEILKSAGEETLGMSEPPPEQMETVSIGTESLERWQRAAAIAEGQLKTQEVTDNQ